MPERTGRCFVGVGRRHPVAMRSILRLSKPAVRSVSALAPNPDPASRLNSEMRADLRRTSKRSRYVRLLSSSIPEIDGDWAERKDLGVINFELTLGVSVV